MKAPLQEQARHPAAWALDRARRLPASVWGFSRSKPLGGIGLAILVGLVLIGIFRGVIAPYDPERVFNQTTETEDKPAETLRLRGPFTSGTVSELPDDAVTVDDIIVEDVFFLLGTDQLSKDVFSRLVCGAWTATKLSLSAVVLATLAGSIIGLLSGYYGGRLDLFAQRIVDAWLSIPGLILAIAIVGGIGASTLTIIIAISSFLWPATSRVIRSVTLSVKESQYVEAARALGAGDVRIMLRHVLPQTNGAPDDHGLLHRGHRHHRGGGAGLPWSRHSAGAGLVGADAFGPSGDARAHRAAPRRLARTGDHRRRVRGQPARRLAPRRARPQAPRRPIAC